ncbi:MAG: hypothetical protein PHP29_03565 [Tissierellia bacterium]|nr:hypothetical protein [Tissierellia bacterium]
MGNVLFNSCISDIKAGFYYLLMNSFKNISIKLYWYWFVNMFIKMEGINYEK